MPTPPRPLNAALGTSFSTAAARAAGHPKSRLRALDLESPYRGVHRTVVPAPPIDDEPLARDRAERARLMRDADAYFRVAPEHAFLVGRSAAVVWRMFLAAGEDLCVGVFAPHRAPRRPGIRGRKVAAHLASVRLVDGVRVTSPASTWAMLGGELSHRDLVVAGDALVRIPRGAGGIPHPEHQLATPAQLEAAAMARGRLHRAALLRALADIRIGSMSPAETDYRLGAAAAGLPEPALDHEVRGAAGILLGISEVVYPDYDTAVEIEGDHHRTSRSQWLRDMCKYAAYVRAGKEVVRLTAAQAGNPEGAAIVREVLLRHGWRG